MPNFSHEDIFVVKDIVWNEQWDPRINFKNQLTVDRLEKKHKLKYEPEDDIPKVNLCMTAIVA